MKVKISLIYLSSSLGKPLSSDPKTFAELAGTIESFVRKSIEVDRKLLFVSSKMYHFLLMANIPLTPDSFLEVGKVCKDVVQVDVSVRMKPKFHLPLLSTDVLEYIMAEFMYYKELSVLSIVNKWFNKVVGVLWDEKNTSFWRTQVVNTVVDLLKGKKLLEGSKAKKKSFLDCNKIEVKKEFTREWFFEKKRSILRQGLVTLDRFDRFFSRRDAFEKVCIAYDENKWVLDASAFDDYYTCVNMIVVSQGATHFKNKKKMVKSFALSMLEDYNFYRFFRKKYSYVDLMKYVDTLEDRYKLVVLTKILRCRNIKHVQCIFSRSISSITSMGEKLKEVYKNLSKLDAKKLEREFDLFLRFLLKSDSLGHLEFKFEDIEQFFIFKKLVEGLGFYSKNNVVIDKLFFGTLIANFRDLFPAKMVNEVFGMGTQLRTGGGFAFLNMMGIGGGMPRKRNIKNKDEIKKLVLNNLELIFFHNASNFKFLLLYYFENCLDNVDVNINTKFDDKLADVVSSKPTRQYILDNFGKVIDKVQLFEHIVKLYENEEQIQNINKMFADNLKNVVDLEKNMIPLMRYFANNPEHSEKVFRRLAPPEKFDMFERYIHNKDWAQNMGSFRFIFNIFSKFPKYEEPLLKLLNTFVSANKGSLTFERLKSILEVIPKGKKYQEYMFNIYDPLKIFSSLIEKTDTKKDVKENEGEEEGESEPNAQDVAASLDQLAFFLGYFSTNKEISDGIYKKLTPTLWTTILKYIRGPQFHSLVTIIKDEAIEKIFVAHCFDDNEKNKHVLLKDFKESDKRYFELLGKMDELKKKHIVKTPVKGIMLNSLYGDDDDFDEDQQEDGGDGEGDEDFEKGFDDDEDEDEDLGEDEAGEGDGEDGGEDGFDF